jgi:hypothetical protein
LVSHDREVEITLLEKEEALLTGDESRASVPFLGGNEIKGRYLPRHLIRKVHWNNPC